MIKAISFDLDDTLWAVGPVIRTAESALRHWISANYPRVFEVLDEATIKNLRREVMRAHPQNAHDFTFLRKQVLKSMAEAAGYTSAMVEPAFEVFDDMRNRVDLFPGVEALLKRLSDEYVLIGCSNGNASLQKTGLDQFFDAHVSARSAGAAKPDQKIFAAVVSALQLSPGQILHVGDDPLADVKGARDAGMPSVWVNASGDDWPTEHGESPVTIASVIDLPSVALLQS